MEQIGYCGKFLSQGGLSCQRNNQTVCEHEHIEMNDKDYCQPTANYNCRTFISIYGYICNTTSCIQSDNIIWKWPLPPIAIYTLKIKLRLTTVVCICVYIMVCLIVTWLKCTLFYKQVHAHILWQNNATHQWLLLVLLSWYYQPGRIYRYYHHGEHLQFHSFCGRGIFHFSCTDRFNHSLYKLELGIS